ncbi:FecR domain-containing protein [Orrella dioscoreae]|uniref:Fe2+-dicitrate sensor, membrane component n=1 Tax=Orrella dioscoreae TaxID=1851544 RepID=A0A1C3JX81_9BURK|nr:FecR domain-containing protein [Orrella dioscoreae]SBT23846.1 Fe2+-dicitrate sensor, membrane component [Orrella dioscoreae]SOE49635.1 Fe2+-dicitrate sensor, membrane component [Orrella dioscoreae]
MSAQHDIPDAVLAQAADWFARLCAGDATARERQAWQAWREASDTHRQAWARVEAISQRFAPLQAVPDPRAAATAYRSTLASPGRRRLVLSLAALAGTGLAGWMARDYGVFPTVLSASLADYRTATGEVRELRLPDGTQVWLGTASAFDADYTASLRRLRQWRGEMLVETAADAGRPFVVDTPQGRLRALGTRFLTRLDGDDTRIAVYEGAVEATAASGHAVIIPAGMQARVSAQGVSALTPADLADAQGPRGRYVARNVPLSEMLQALGRYRRGYLSVSPEIADLPVFGSFPMTEPDRVLAMLESVMPIRVQRPFPGWTRVMPR